LPKLATIPDDGPDKHGMVICMRDSQESRLCLKQARGTTMFKGKAELLDPETGKVAATFTEDGTEMKVVLKERQKLSGTMRLAVYSTVKDEELISIAAKDGKDIEVHEFHGTSSLGALTDGAEISLTRSPGGEIGSLLIVLGRGTVHEEKKKH
jgi:hypothetical protein